MDASPVFLRGVLAAVILAGCVACVGELEPTCRREPGLPADHCGPPALGGVCSPVAGVEALKIGSGRLSSL